MPTKPQKTKEKRKRRSAEETKAEILAEAQIALRESGPDAIRLDAVADAIGISRQAVLHHFGSREDLLREVVREAWVGLFKDFQDLANLTERPTDPGAAVGAFIERLDEVGRAKGNARLGAWLLLSDQGLPDEVFEGVLGGLPGQLTALAPDLPLEDVQQGLLLVGAAIFGDAIFGARLRQALALDDTEEGRAQFRSWLATIVLAAVERPRSRS